MPTSRSTAICRLEIPHTVHASELSGYVQIHLDALEKALTGFEPDDMEFLDFSELDGVVAVTARVRWGIAGESDLIETRTAIGRRQGNLLEFPWREDAYDCG